MTRALVLLCALEMKWFVPVAIYQGGWQVGALWCQYMYLVTCIRLNILRCCHTYGPIDYAQPLSQYEWNGPTGPTNQLAHTLNSLQAGLSSMKFKWLLYPMAPGWLLPSSYITPHRALSVVKQLFNFIPNYCYSLRLDFKYHLHTLEPNSSWKMLKVFKNPISEGNRTG